MADAEKTAPEQGNKLPDTDPPQQTRSEEEELSLTVASKSGFNDRAWNDPPPALISGQGSHRPIPINTQRPKLTARVGYDASKQGGSGDASKTVLDPKGPPPKSGFVQASPRSSDHN